MNGPFILDNERRIELNWGDRLVLQSFGIVSYADVFPAQLFRVSQFVWSGEADEGWTSWAGRRF